LKSSKLISTTATTKSRLEDEKLAAIKAREQQSVDLKKTRQDLDGLRPFKKQFEDASAESEKRKLEVDKLNKRISELETSNRNALDERKKQIQKLESDIKSLETLRGDVSERDKKIASLNGELETARKKASELTNAQEQLKKDAQAKDAQHQSKVKELEPWQQRLKEIAKLPS